MGYYIEGPTHGKGKFLEETYGATKVNKEEAFRRVKLDAVIVVIHNGSFEAAGFAYDDDEFKNFTMFGDYRPKEFYIMNRNKAKELTGYKHE